MRYWRAHLLREARPCQVIEDTGRGLLVWLAAGTVLKALLPRTGGQPRALAQQLATDWYMSERTWWGDGALQWFPPDRAAYSVSWFFDTGRFAGWYVNLEAPARRWSHGVDTSDHALDIWVNPDRTWRLKDEAEFTERTGHPWYWTHEQAHHIRATVDQVTTLVAGAAYPFDGTWCEFTPDHNWPQPELPENWNSPADQSLST